MTKERREIVEGISYAIDVMKLRGKGVSPEMAIVFYGKDDGVTLGEAVEVLAQQSDMERNEENLRLVNILNGHLSVISSKKRDNKAA